MRCGLEEPGMGSEKRNVRKNEMKGKGGKGEKK